jgi:tetratricopeptide (TPR) repeat protein
MRTFSCYFFLAALLLFQGITTKAQTSPHPKEKELQSLFNKFFSLNDNDTSQIKEKLATGQKIISICSADSSESRFCNYVSIWAAILEGEYKTGLDGIESLEYNFPDWAELYFLHAQYLHYKKEEGAIEKAQKCLELKPNLSEPVYFLAVNYFEMNNFRLSLKYYDQLEKINPRHKSVYYNRANVKAQLKDTAGAIGDFSKALQNDPLNYKARYNRGALYYQTSKYQMAITDFDEFIKLYPGYAKAYQYRGASKYYLGLKEEACVDMKKAVSLGSNELASYISANCN